MSLLNSKERRARNRGRKQGYQKCIEDIKEYITRYGIDTDSEPESIHKEHLLHYIEQLETANNSIPVKKRVNQRRY